MHVTDSSVESGHIAAIIVGVLLGLTLLCYITYRLAQRYCPNLLQAITPQDSPRPLNQASFQQQKERERRADTEMAAQSAAEDRAQLDKKGNSHAEDMAAAASPLSVNEQWTVRVTPAEEEDAA